MDGNRPEQSLYDTSTIAKELGLTRHALNRLALAYERVHGALPRGQRHARLWAPEAIERIRSARLAVEEGRAVNIEAALRGLEPHSTSEQQNFGVQSSQVPERSSEGTPEARPPSRLLEVLVSELHALREAVEDQNSLLRDQAHRLRRLEATVPLRPVAPADLSEEEDILEPSQEPERSAENREVVGIPRQTDTDHRVSGAVLPIVLITGSVVVTVISALYDNVLLLTASLAVTTISFLFSWYYYYAKG
jgi:hypothetical protein